MNAGWGVAVSIQSAAPVTHLSSWVAAWPLQRPDGSSSRWAGRVTGTGCSHQDPTSPWPRALAVTLSDSL